MSLISNPHAKVGARAPSRTAIPAITVWQPWASLIAEGIKTIEFRGWCAPRRLWGRRVAIHAAARPARRDEMRGILLDLDKNPDRSPLAVEPARIFLDRALSAPGSLRTSAVVCIATLDVPIPPDAVAEKFANDSDRDGHFSWGWPLADIERLDPPIPASGAQGWWWWERPA